METFPSPSHSPLPFSLSVSLFFAHIAHTFAPFRPSLPLSIPSSCPFSFQIPLGFFLELQWYATYVTRSLPWTPTDVALCYIAEFFSPTARSFIGYFEVTWNLTIKLLCAKSLWAGSSAKSMTSEGNSALLPANVDRRPPLLSPLHVFLFVLYNNHLIDWSLGKKLCFFPSNLMFPSAATRGNIEIRHVSPWRWIELIVCLWKESEMPIRIAMFFV